MPAGRPSKYRKETGELICALLGRGKSLMEICELDSMPTRETVYNWLQKDKDFFNAYARARVLQEEHYFDLIANVAFDESRDESGELRIPNAVAVQRDRLKVDTLKWKLGRMNPRKYGDKIEVSGELAVKRVVSDI